jgi:hypothetical protein
MNPSIADANIKVASDHGVAKLNPDGHRRAAEAPDCHKVIVIPFTLEKRSKPRRQSGLEVSALTENDFRINRQDRPLFTRDDSLSLLKHRTTGAVVPIEEPEPQPQQQQQPQKQPQKQPQQQPQKQPLSRINRRSKPRLHSGVAVANKTKPVLAREDSLLLTKKRLAGISLITLETEPPTLEDDCVKKGADQANPTAAQKKKSYVRQNSLTARSA